MDSATPIHALQGLKVLEFSMGVAGPHAAFLCAQHGADVVKVEPHHGDWCRTLGQPRGDLSAFFIAYNRGKRSIAIDMKDPEALEAVKAMARQADIIIEAYRPGVMARFGLDYATVSAGNPGVIYLSVNGFGSTGPLVDAPATDTVLQGFAGIMYSNRDAQGEPQRIDHVLIDVITGLYGFQTLLTALLNKNQAGGAGRHLECSLLKSAMAFQAGKILEDVLEGGTRPVYVPVGIFATEDGRVSISVRGDDHFAALCRLLGRADLVDGGEYATAAMRVERADVLLPQLRAEFAKHSTRRLCALLSDAGILHAPVNSYADLLAHEQTQAVDAVRWHQHNGVGEVLPLAATPGSPGDLFLSDAPHIGEHTREAMMDWGVSAANVDVLLASGAIPSSASH
ncbi:CoA transferase [Alcaligenaceae bacterium]|nr:CoA transferase [Alcaligenaceae bacterium]